MYSLDTSEECNLSMTACRLQKENCYNRSLENRI